MEIKFTEKLNKCMEKFRSRLEIVSEGGVAIFASYIPDTLIGQVAPGIVTSLYAYKQKRFENNIIALINEIQSRIAYIEEKVSKLDEKTNHQIKTEIFPLLFDYAIDEKQIEKLKYFVKGFETILDQKIIDKDIVIGHFDILAQLKVSDIELLLKIYDETLNDEKIPIHWDRSGYSQQRLNNLIRFGLAFEPPKPTMNRDSNPLAIHTTNYGNTFVNFLKNIKL